MSATRLDREQRAAVVAHFDVSRKLAHHVRLMLEELLSVCSQVVLVSTTGVDYESSLWISRHPALKLVVRENVGYDFMSYREGIRHLGDVEELAGTELLICNDSFVGPVVPLATMLDQMDGSPDDFWGMTLSHELSMHVQSYFMYFRSSATATPAFQNFWRDMVVISDREEVIRRYELGLSRALMDAGLRPGAYFRPSPRDVWEACERQLWWLTPTGVDGAVAEWRERTVKRYLDDDKRNEFNATVVLADRILDGSLPILKLEVARLDPWGLNANWLLDQAQRVHPRWFSRVRDYLRATDGESYAHRKANIPVTGDTQPIQSRIVYHEPRTEVGA